MPRDDFTPRHTTWLFPGEDSRDIDVITIARALGERNQHVHGLQPRFGGKAYDITWTSEEEALEAASSGVDILERHYELRLLGRRKTDVSIFVACEFPDSYLVELLERYGEFDDDNIRHLTLKDAGLTHIENGVRVVSFTSIDRPIPHTIVYRGTPLGFRYTGQAKLCFKCASPDHLVRDCPKKLPPLAQPTEQDAEQSAEPPPLAESEQNTPANTDHDHDPANEADTSDMDTTDSTPQAKTSVVSSPLKEPCSKRA